jgi:hypothetical protein
MLESSQKRGVKIKKIGGRSYAYDMISYWDKESKKYRKRSLYLGVITNNQTREYAPKKAFSAVPQNELIQNFGATYSIAKVLENSGLNKIIKDVLPDEADTLLSLICHKIINGSAMQYVESWAKGNYVSALFPNAELSSQRISDFLKRLGKESVWRKFFKAYIQQVAGEKVGVIIDSTGLPNEIDIPLSAWGNHGGEAERETRLLIVVDRITGNPLYFRYAAGNIVDVSTLANTFAELEQMGVKTSFALIDAGYYSENNINDLYTKHIRFLTRLPSGRALYKSLIGANHDVESAKHIVTYGKRALYVKRVPVDLFGNNAFAYIVCDIKRKGIETTRYLIEAKEDNLSDDEINQALSEKGKFIIISSDEIPINEVIPLYYTRQSAENLFGVSKSFLDMLPIRTHSIETMRGYLMLTFLALITYVELKKCLKGTFTVESALTEMSNLMAKIYGNTTIVLEPTKNMKALASLFGYMVPMKLGV